MSMRAIPPPRLLAFCVVMAFALAVPQAAHAQQTPRAIPRTADGKPDLSGVWLGGGFGLLLGEQEAAAIRKADAAAKRPAFQQEPPPYKPEAAARRQYYLDRRGVDDPMAKCLLSGVPRITVRPLPFEIIQFPNRVVILYSVARWEGDTLVVDVVGFNTDTWLAGVGTIHSEKLRVTERYTRDTFDTIVYDVTMEDPEVFTKPWKQQAILRLLPKERIREYECIENNEDIQRWEKLLQNDPALRASEPKP